MSQPHPGSLLGGILLVAGTSIGGGMLALPVLTGSIGFFPSLLLFLGCWLLMVSTGLLYLEACLWFKGDVNLVSMSGQTMGFFGRAICWTLYLFLFYCLTFAYIEEGGNLLQNWLPFSKVPASFFFLALFVPFVYLGTKAVDAANKVLMMGLIVSYAAFVVTGFSYINQDRLLTYHFAGFSGAIPICLTSFGYHGVIPTLAKYLHYDIQKMKRAIIIGSAIPFVIYVLWQALILGIVPLEGEHGLLAAGRLGQSAVQPLSFFINQSAVFTLGQLFGFFALSTSFLGVTLPLKDFLADGLKVKKEGWGNGLLLLLILAPTLAISFTYPHLFLKALNLAGGIGGAVILGLLPIWIVFAGRYYRGFTSSYRAPFGKPALFFLMALIFYELAVEFGSLSL
ncbi:MAG: tyrp3 [Chlamydiales bacterium]|jgi:tyrosine-specific transport protein|nr:tyrp3 [Chlamydiales bacterium]